MSVNVLVDPRLRTSDDSKPDVHIDPSSIGDPALRRVRLAPPASNTIVLELVSYTCTLEGSAPAQRPLPPPPPPIPQYYPHAHVRPHLPPPGYVPHPVPLPGPAALQAQAMRKRKLSEAEGLPPPHGAPSRLPDADGPPPARKVKLFVKQPGQTAPAGPPREVIDLT